MKYSHIEPMILKTLKYTPCLTDNEISFKIGGSPPIISRKFKGLVKNKILIKKNNSYQINRLLNNKIVKKLPVEIDIDIYMRLLEYDINEVLKGKTNKIERESNKKQLADKEHEFMITYKITSVKIETIKLVIQGKKYKAIAERLNKKFNTIRNQLKYIYKKLDIHSGAELMMIYNNSVK